MITKLNIDMPMFALKSRTPDGVDPDETAIKCALVQVGGRDWLWVRIGEERCWNDIYEFDSPTEARRWFEGQAACLSPGETVERVEPL